MPEDVSRAGVFVRRGLGLADEDRLSTVCIRVVDRDLAVVRTDDLNTEHDRVDRHPGVLEARHRRIGRPCVVRNAAVQSPDKRRGDQARAGLDGEPHLEQTPDTRTRPGSLVFIGIKIEEFDQPVIQPELQLVPCARHRLVERPLETDLEQVLAIEREVVPHSQATARPERKVFAHASFLEQQRGCLVHRRAGAERRVAHSAPADLGRRRHVAGHQTRRDRQHVTDVVEPVTRVVGREEGASVHLQPEQVTDRIGVFGPVEPMHFCGPARIWIRSGCLVERGLQM